ncbi:MAG: exo-alpha-sialidase [Planctomycetes bacterium]|nr:exo-alpha-sialidase [Planctomycetota bacterium]
MLRGHRVSERQRQRGRAAGAQYELYQPSIRYSMICEGQTPPLEAKYQHCAAVERFDGRFFAVWQSNPTVHIEWGRGRKIYFSTSEDFGAWSAPELVAPELPHVGGTQPLLLHAPQGELWCLWLCSSRDPDVHGMQISTLRPGSKTWTHRRMFGDDRVDLDLSFYPQTNPWVLTSGRIIVPFIARLGQTREPAGVFAYTDDDGATWRLSNWIRWPLNDRGQGIWEVHGSEQIDGVIRVFARNNAWDSSRPETALLTTTGTGASKGTPLRFDADVEYAGVQALQNRPQVFGLGDKRFCLLVPDGFAEALPWRTASLHFSRSGRNDYTAGPAIVPSGVTCSYPQGVAHNGGLYAVFTGEYPDDWRNIVGVSILPAPEADRFYLWPRHRSLGPYVRSPAPTAGEVDGRRCVVFRGSGSAGVDTLPVDLAAGKRLELRFDVKVQAARRGEESVLLSFGDMAGEDLPPIRIGGPSLAKGRLSVSTGTDWQELAPFALDAWHSLSLEFVASHATVRVDNRPPRTINASAGEMNPRVYLGEGVIVDGIEPSRDFGFAVDLASIRTGVH